MRGPIIDAARGELGPVFEPIQFDSEERATRTAKEIAGRRAGVIACSREANPDIGECRSGMPFTGIADPAQLTILQKMICGTAEPRRPRYFLGFRTALPASTTPSSDQIDKLFGLVACDTRLIDKKSYDDFLQSGSWSFSQQQVENLEPQRRSA